MAKIRQNFALAGLSGLIAALAYSYSHLGFLAFIALVPLLISLRSVSELKFNKRKLFQLGGVAGLVYFLFSFRWYLSLHPLNGLGIENRFTSILIAVAIWLSVAIAMSVFWGLFSLLIVRLKSRLTSKIILLEVLTIPALFVLIDYLRSYAIAIVFHGSGGIIGPHWTLGNLAYALSNNSLILSLASFVGIYGVLFVLVSINIIIFKLFILKKRKHFYIVILFVIALAFGGKAWIRKETGDKIIQFSIIQTNQQRKLSDNSENGLNSFKQQLELLARTVKESPKSTVIVFPEGSNFFKNLSVFLTPAQAKNYFTKLSKEPKLIIDNSRIAINSQTAYSRVLFLNSQKDIAGFYDKKLLTPGGEYLPTFAKIIAGLAAPNTKESFEGLFAFSAGKEQKIASFNGSNFRAAACSDFISPSLFRNQAQDADAVIGLASISTFHGSASLVNQSLAINKFRAAENNTPFILAANSGRSYALNNLGNTIKIAPDDQPQILTGEVVLGARKSWYNKVGDWPIFLTSILILLASFVISIKSPKK